MSEENRIDDVEQFVASGLDALNSRDPDALFALGQPDAEFTSVLAGTEGGVYRGRDGWRDYFHDIEETFVDFAWGLDEIVGWRGDDLVVVSRLSGRGRASGASVEVSLATVWTFREGKPWRGVTYSSKAEALEAAGLREWRKSAGPDAR
jgi:ketosteroid isomerase-like protein